MNTKSGVGRYRSNVTPSPPKLPRRPFEPEVPTTPPVGGKGGECTLLCCCEIYRVRTSYARACSSGIVNTEIGPIFVCVCAWDYERVWKCTAIFTAHASRFAATHCAEHHVLQKCPGFAIVSWTLVWVLRTNHFRLTKNSCYEVFLID